MPVTGTRPIPISIGFFVLYATSRSCAGCYTAATSTFAPPPGPPAADNVPVLVLAAPPSKLIDLDVDLDVEMEVDLNVDLDVPLEKYAQAGVGVDRRRAV